MGSLYKGGIIRNSEFDSGLMGWLVPGGVKAGVSSSPSGNRFASAKNKGQPSRSVYQKIQMQTNHHYSLSGKVNNDPSFIAPQKKYYISAVLNFVFHGSMQRGCRFFPARPR